MSICNFNFLFNAIAHMFRFQAVFDIGKTFFSRILLEVRPSAIYPFIQKLDRKDSSKLSIHNQYTKVYSPIKPSNYWQNKVVSPSNRSHQRE